MQLINLTSHVVVLSENGLETTVFHPSGKVASVEILLGGKLFVEQFNFPIHQSYHYGVVTGLPKPQPGIGYIVRKDVAIASGRPDVFYPDSYDAVKRNGKPVYYRRLIQGG